MATATCTNPRCTCSPCTCGEVCKCRGGQLGELERRVMDIVWASGGEAVTARAVADAMPEYAYTTVATVLNRLSRKGVVRRRLEGRTTRFTAVGTLADRAAAAMLDALDSSGDREAAIARFAERASAADLDSLRRALGSSRTR